MWLHRTSEAPTRFVEVHSCLDPPSCNVQHDLVKTCILTSCIFRVMRITRIREKHSLMMLSPCPCPKHAEVLNYGTGNSCLATQLFSSIWKKKIIKSSKLFLSNSAQMGNHALQWSSPEFEWEDDTKLQVSSTYIRLKNSTRPTFKFWEKQAKFFLLLLCILVGPKSLSYGPSCSCPHIT